MSEQYSADMSLKKTILASFFLLILNETWIRHSHSSIPIILLPCRLDGSSDTFSCSLIFLVIYVITSLGVLLFEIFLFPEILFSSFSNLFFLYIYIFLFFTLSIHSLVSLLLVNIYFIHFSANSCVWSLHGSKPAALFPFLLSKLMVSCFWEWFVLLEHGFLFLGSLSVKIIGDWHLRWFYLEDLCLFPSVTGTTFSLNCKLISLLEVVGPPRS